MPRPVVHRNAVKVTHVDSQSDVFSPPSDDLASKSKDELYELAQEADIEGRSSMTKSELIAALEADQ